MTDTTPESAARTICNPMDLAYRYQDVRFSGSVGGVELGPARRSVHREAADPSIVRFGDRYFLFASMSHGFWHSTDLVSWEYRATDKLPPLDYAPDVRVVRGALIISASRKDDASPFLRSADPLADDFTRISPGPFPFWDPNLFEDEDGRVYLFWGCDNVQPLYGVELDADFEPIGEPVALAASDPSTRGWERLGEDYVVPEPTTELERRIAQFTATTPYVEGAWVDRVGDTYYLQYAAPGTQWNTYADGYLTAPHPLGPYTYATASPFSSKPGGFVGGAGHGSTFQDAHGNWWHAATMRISVNDVFERRIGLFPAGFDADGVLFCNQTFGDYPFAVPEGSFDPWRDWTPRGMLQSRGAGVTASSTAAGREPAAAVDEDIRTWWACDGAGEGEWIAVDLGAVVTVTAVQMNLADHELADVAAPLEEGVASAHTWRGIYRDHAPAQVLIEGSVDGDAWEVLFDGASEGGDRPHALVTPATPRALRHVRATAQSLPFGGPFAVSGLRVFGHGGGAAPAPAEASAVRVDARTARVSWNAVPGAHGYTVRYGASPDALYRSWQVFARTELEVPSLNAGEDTWFAVDAFNENGVTPGVAVPGVTPR